jgi:hypothetical protein
MRPFEGPTASAAVDISDIRSGAAGYSLTIFGHVPLRVLMPVRGRVADRGHVVVHWSVSRVCFVFSRFFRNIPKYSEIFRRFRNIPEDFEIFRNIPEYFVRISRYCRGRASERTFESPS